MQTRMKGSPMTETPTPGAAPENRRPDENRDPEQSAAEDRSDAVGQTNPTEPLDRSAASENHTQQLPGAPRPVYPPRGPLYGQTAPNPQTQNQQAHSQHGHSQQPQGHQPYGQPAPGPYGTGHPQSQHGAHSAAPGGYTGQHNTGHNTGHNM